jgi:7,8-dihydropterin-6-yl-methyl-4-(beta-D-ribofuranosyl)aminobenzene 5'-phosphate synthase
MLLTVLFDNNPLDPALATGWGFSAWLEYGGQTVLMDTGADGGILLGNMAALGLDAGAVDIVLLSHNHADHTGGLAGLLAANAQACTERGQCITVYLPAAFPSRFKAQARTAGATVVEVDDPLEIVPGLWSTGQMGTGIVEQALVAETSQGLLVVTGCAHPGVERMVARAMKVGGGQVHLVVGGFHLGGAGRERVDEIVAELQRLGVQKVAPCHCTGDAARELFREAYGTGFYPCGVGWQWQDEG